VCPSFRSARAQSGSKGGKLILIQSPVYPQYPITLFSTLKQRLKSSSLKRWHHSEVLRKPLSFPEGNPILFQTFITFIRTGQLRHPNPLETATSSSLFAFLCALIKFASKYNAFTMRNTILDIFFLRVYETGRIPFENMQDVYAAAKEGSSFRDLVTHITINIGSKQSLEKWGNTLSAGFLMDCLGMASDDGVVPFKADVDKWLENKRRWICAHHHVHEREQQEESSGEESDGEEEEFEDYMDMSSAAVQQRREEAQVATDRELAFIAEMRRNAVRY
jgi:hypothetical protein